MTPDDKHSGRGRKVLPHLDQSFGNQSLKKSNVIV
jgi:hypothetical protein